MAKTRDYPHELRHLAKIFNSFRGHYYEYDIFRDLIDYITASLLWEGDQNVAEDLRRRYAGDYERFGEAFLAICQTMQEQLAVHTWYDVFGTIYEVVASRNKCSFLGQFFTPATVCDFMAKITAAEQPVPDGRRPTINDPACGSGRTMLAFNAIVPGGYIVCQDLDPICTKMAAINMALHGIQGQSVNGNALDPAAFVFGYEINPRLYTLGGFPHMVPITREQSFPIQMWEKQLEVIEAAKIPPQVVTPVAPKKSLLIKKEPAEKSKNSSAAFKYSR